MTSREIIIVGKALKALIELGANDKVKEIVDYMAEENPGSRSYKASQLKKRCRSYGAAFLFTRTRI